MWPEYFLFLLKAVTVGIVLIAILLVIAQISKGNKNDLEGGKLLVRKLNDRLDHLKNTVNQSILSKEEYKALQKENKKSEKTKPKITSIDQKLPIKKAYVIKFVGDIQASQVASFRQEVDAVLTVATSGEEVIVIVETPGGSVSGYGLAASQLIRLKTAGLHLTVCIDKVAASGGYMMACIADKIIAAPFSIVGSIGVVSQIPNIHRFLKRFDIDVDVLTAGKHKAPLTFLGENSDEGRDKHKQDLEAIHHRFKQLVHSYRKKIDIDAVSEGDFWLAKDALEHQLIDEIDTSDSYLFRLCQSMPVYSLKWKPNQGISDRIKGIPKSALEGIYKRMLP